MSFALLETLSRDISRTRPKGSLQKKKCNKCYMGGGLAGQNVTLTKVVFKIHVKPF